MRLLAGRPAFNAASATHPSRGYELLVGASRSADTGSGDMNKNRIGRGRTIIDRQANQIGFLIGRYPITLEKWGEKVMRKSNAK